jgi:hypothetical protein
MKETHNRKRGVEHSTLVQQSLLEVGLERTIDTFLGHVVDEWRIFSDLLSQLDSFIDELLGGENLKHS